MLKLALLTLVTGCFVATTGSMQARQEEFYQRICTDSQYAYEHGYNKGRNREPMSTQWAERCVPDVRGERQQAYVAGYQAASATAPPRVDIRVEGNAASGGTTACTFDADCGPGRACRAIDGGKVCMGEGAAGDYCWFSSDCLSGSCDLGTKYCR